MKRHGHKKAIVAIACMILTCIYHIFQIGEIFNPVDIDYFNISDKVLDSKREQVINNAVKTLSKFGIDISILDLTQANI